MVQRWGKRRRATAVVVALAAAAAVAGALSGAHPTSTPGVDPLYAALWAALITVAASRASRSALLVLAAAAVVLSRSWLWLPAGAALGVAFASSFQRRAHQRLGALVGALASQVLLRWPHVGFHGFSALVAAVVAVPVLVSGFRHAGRRTRRIALTVAGCLGGLATLATAAVALSALSARGPVSRGTAAARSALSEVEAGRAPSATLQLRTGASDFAAARSRVGAWWNWAGYLVPVVAQQQRALARATTAGAQLTAVAAREAGAFDLQQLRYRGGHIDLRALRRLEGPIGELNGALASAMAGIDRSRSPWLIGPLAAKLSHLGAEVDKADKATSLAAAAVKGAPGLLGADGVRHYFVAFVNPAETRGLDGFIGAYGVLRVDNGSIKLSASGTPGQLNNALPPHPKLTGLASYMARYGRFEPQKHFQDVTYAPDLPTVEKVIAELYPQAGGTHIDGVMVLDPYALAALLSFTGPVSLPGVAGQLTSANAADVLLRTQYLAPVQGGQRHDLLDAALTTGFHKLAAGSLPSPKTLGAVLGPMVREGHLMLWSSHRSDQPLLDRLGLSGAFPRPGPSSDVLAVTVSNSGNSKIDAYLHQQVSDHVLYNPGNGEITSTVTIRLHNSAPSSGLPRIVIGSFDKSLSLGTSYLWVSLYSPLQVTSATVNGDKASFSAPIPELGVLARSLYVQVFAHSTSVLTVTLHGRLQPGPAYRLATRLQPLVNRQSFTATVSAVKGWYESLPADLWIANSDMTQNRAWGFVHG